MCTAYFSVLTRSLANTAAYSSSLIHTAALETSYGSFLNKNTNGQHLWVEQDYWLYEADHYGMQ